MASENTTTTVYSPNYSIKIHKWKVREGFQVNNNQLILLYELVDGDDKEIKRLKSTKCGVVKKRHHKDGDIVDVERPLLELTDCIHATVIKDMCADCGADLRQDESGNQSEANVPMIHSVPELKVSHELALELGKADTVGLLKDRKLVLLVDLDQTVIHTTNDNVPKNLKGVYHFQLYGPNSPWYHTRLRPGTFSFLKNVAPFYELHICTFGARNYAHTIAQFLDEDGKYFSHRILSRDECLSLTCKTDNLRALFPCGDAMVCIIDDREDVWNMATNLIQVKPYHFFQHTGDINAPPGMSKHELDGKGVDFTDLEEKAKKVAIDKKSDEAQKSAESTEKESPPDEDVAEAKAKEKDDVPKTPEHISEENADVVEDYLPESAGGAGNSPESGDGGENSSESAGGGENRPDVDDEVKKETENATTKEGDASATIGQSNEGILTNASDSSGDNENATDKPDSVIKIETPGDDNLIEIEDPDDYLLYLEAILLKIHTRFYAYYDENKQIPDLKTLVPKIRSEVLVGKTLVFSGMVPSQIKLEKSRAYLIARSLGATVTQQLTDEATHLVASTAGTFKVNAARKMPHIHIVAPDWLWSCAERWECVEEKLFPLDSRKSVKTRQPPAHCHSPEHVPNYMATVSSASEPSTSGTEDANMKFIDTINPMLSFSNDDLEAMNKDVEDFFDSDSSSDDSVDIENPPMDKSLRKRKREEENEEVQRKMFHSNESKGPDLSCKGKQKSKTSGKNNGSSSSGSSSSDSSSNSNKSSDTEDESLVDKFRRGGDMPSDLDMGSNDGSGDSANSDDANDDGDDGDWNMMGAALEREFLGMDEN